MPLASHTVDAIFARMTVRYGSAWFAKWDGVPIESVKADWARELEGVSRYAIVYALGFLPSDFPPTVSAFLAICRRAPDRAEAAPEIAGPKADPQRVAEILGRVPRVAGQDPKAWARRLREREEEHGGVLENGKRMTLAQRDMWRAALHWVRAESDEREIHSQLAEDARARLGITA
jgi:hypothetical protein